MELAIDTSTSVASIALADKGCDVTAGLAAEAEQLKTIFETHDAQAGIRAALSRQRPAFEGR